MKSFAFENNWDAIKGQLQQRYGQLTDDDVAFTKGKGEELTARLRDKLGISGGDLDTLLNELNAGAGGTMDQIKAKAGELAGQARERATALAGDWKERAASVGEDAKAQASVAYDQARQRVGNLQEEGEKYVRQNPREALMGALVAGFVAGLLLRR